MMKKLDEVHGLKKEKEEQREYNPGRENDTRFIGAEKYIQARMLHMS